MESIDEYDEHPENESANKANVIIIKCLSFMCGRKCVADSLTRGSAKREKNSLEELDEINYRCIR